jgi:hypothetical protein
MAMRILDWDHHDSKGKEITGLISYKRPVSRAVAYPGIFFRGGGCSTNPVEDRGQRTAIWGP